MCVLHLIRCEKFFCVPSPIYKLHGSWTMAIQYGISKMKCNWECLREHSENSMQSPWEHIRNKQTRNPPPLNPNEFFLKPFVSLFIGSMKFLFFKRGSPPFSTWTNTPFINWEYLYNMDQTNYPTIVTMHHH